MVENIKINAIICEFNPLHKGHKYIIDKMSENCASICIMSGNFVQRGDVSIVDKWTKAKMALACGADLVLELPIPIATACAKTFASGAVEILTKLGIVDNLYFGSESGDVTALSNIVDTLYTNEYKQLLKENLKTGISFAKARELSVSDILEQYDGQLENSNNNLAIEYLCAIKEQNSNMKPVTVTRLGAKHDQHSDDEFLSAMQIRDMIKNEHNTSEHLPVETEKYLQKAISKKLAPCLLDKCELAILFKLRTLSLKQLSLLPDVSEGIHNKFFKAIKQSNSIAEIIENTKSKRYTHARIRRMILHAFLGITAQMQEVKYCKILAVSELGQKILKSCNKNFPLIGKISDFKNLDKSIKEQFDFDCICDDVYELTRPVVGNCSKNYTKKIIKLNI